MSKLLSKPVSIKPLGRKRAGQVTRARFSKIYLASTGAGRQRHPGAAGQSQPDGRRHPLHCQRAGQRRLQPGRFQRRRLKPLTVLVLLLVRTGGVVNYDSKYNRISALVGPGGPTIRFALYPLRGMRRAGAVPPGFLMAPPCGLGGQARHCAFVVVRAGQCLRSSASPVCANTCSHVWSRLFAARLLPFIHGLLSSGGDENLLPAGFVDA